MGEGSWFFILLFIFWVMESIAKARQKKRQAQVPKTEGSWEQLPPAGAEVPGTRTTGTGAARRDRNLFEELARELQRLERPAEDSPVEATASEEGATSGREGDATDEEALPVVSVEEQGSERWAAGFTPESTGQEVTLVSRQRVPLERAALRTVPTARRVRTAAAPPKDVHGLRNLSHAELRRIVVLRELLGPPVSLREERAPDA